MFGFGLDLFGHGQVPLPKFPLQKARPMDVGSGTATGAAPSVAGAPESQGLERCVAVSRVVEPLAALMGSESSTP